MIPALGKLRQEDGCGLQVQPMLQSEMLPQEKERKEGKNQKIQTNKKKTILLRKSQYWSWFATPPPPSPALTLVLRIGGRDSLVLLPCRPSPEGAQSPLPGDETLRPFPTNPPTPGIMGSWGEWGWRPVFQPTHQAEYMQYLSVCLCVQLSCGASRHGQRGHSGLRPATGQADVTSVISVFLSLFLFGFVVCGYLWVLDCFSVFCLLLNFTKAETIARG